MAARDFEGVFYVKCPPEIVFDDGNYHIGYDISPRAHIEFVMSQRTYERAMLLAEEARAVAKLGGTPKAGNVCRIRRKK